MELHVEYIEFLRNQVKVFDKELLEMRELPSVDSLRHRIKKEKRDTKVMLALYKHMTECDDAIRTVKDAIRFCNKEAMKLLGHNLQRPKRTYKTRDDYF